MTKTAQVPEFKFDFDKLQGLDFEAAMVAAYHQLEDHYNKHIKPAPILFGGKPFAAPAAPQTLITPLSPKAAVPPPLEVINPDLETITPKTIHMKKFVIVPDEDQPGRFILRGTSIEDKEVEDRLLVGYDKKPYGPVVTAEHGRYNLVVPHA